jgi:Protein of unknown function (DUF1552)
VIITKKALSRRTFLQGAGVTLALPLLDAMVPAMTAIAQTPAKTVRRLGFVYIPMGMNPVDWMPATEGKISQLPPSLAALTPYLDHMTVFSNFELKTAYEGTGTHATANACFMTAAHVKQTEGNDYRLGTSVDQIAAQHIGKDTPIPSLELQTELLAQVGGCDNGLACVYYNCLSWSSPTTPLPAEPDPRVVFERLFGSGGTAAQRQARLQRNASILDSVSQEMAKLQREVGAGDRVKLNQYLDSVREVERRIQKAEQQTTLSPLAEPERPAAMPDWEQRVKLMFDLQTLAFQGNMTRITTFQLAREASRRAYPNIGVPEVHHDISHHGNRPEKLMKLSKINAYHVTLFSYFLERLTASPDGDGSLLDHSMILLGSGISNPNLHDHSNLPIIVAGGGTAKHRGGRHIKYPHQTPLSNLYLAMLDEVGVHQDSFADSTGRISDLL